MLQRQLDKLSSVPSKVDKISAGFDKAGKKISAVSEKVTKVGEGLTKGVTVPVAAAGAASAVSTDYQLNDTIEHKKWGQGVVVGVSGSGDDLSIRVIFPDIGMKDLFVKYAPIKKV
jgi:hypothetical protein